jgi:hypothetical protein
MRISAKLLLLPLLLLTNTITKAQVFGGNPPSIKWNQVNTPAARVIFPVGLDSAAIRIANIVGQMNKAIQPTIGLKQKQIDIVLQNQTTISNAYVQLAPFRSEFYFTPPQNSFVLGSLHWVDQLAVHEFRHVQQFNNFDVGAARVMHVLFGEGGQSVANGLAIPNWFFEGDAVFNETYVTNQGRGRLPSFFDGYRALWAAGKNYSWMKLRNGSYQDFVPDHYPLGYMLVAYGRDKYGDDFWKNVTHDAASFNGVFYPMQKAITKYSGVGYEQFGKDAFEHFKLQYGLAWDNSQNVPANGLLMLDRPVVVKRHFIADQEYPAFVDDSTMLYVKTTYDHVPAFVIKTGNTERVIRVHDYSLDNYFAYHDGKIIYASYRPDLRWGDRNYAELSILDIHTGKQTRITKATKYFSPAFSEDGKNIVAVQQGPDGKSQLHILDLSGKLISVIPNKDNLFYTYPKFYKGKILSAVRNSVGGMSITLTDIGTGNNEYLLPFAIQPIAFPAVVNDKVYFSATSDKNDALFALSLTDKKLYELKNSELKSSIGNYQPTVSRNKIAWTSFTAYGYILHELDVAKVEWQALPGNVIPGALPQFDIAALNKGDAVGMLATVNNAQPGVTKYQKAFHLLNFHSLTPAIADPNYGFAIQGENVINTLQTELLFNYNRNEGYKEFGVGAVYGALFPYLSVGADYIVDRAVNYSLVGSPGINTSYYNETQIHGGVQFPFNLTRGRTFTTLSVSSQLVYDLNSFQSPLSTFLPDRNYMYVNNFLSLSVHGRQGHKNIYPHLGESLVLNYQSAITNITGHQFLAVNTVFLPGFGVNHNLVLQGAYQERDKPNGANFSNNFPTSRGYTGANVYQQYRLSANYHFPIVYPDAGVANAVYFLRIRGNLFFDYGYDINTLENGYKFRSTGSEVFFDTQLFNTYPVSVGIRYSHLLDSDIYGSHGSNRIELVLPLTIF